MTGKNCKHVNSMLPLSARTARIAAGGGVVAHAHDFPSAGSMDLSCPGLNSNPTQTFTITEPFHKGETHEQSTDDWT